jgi:DNA mismatch endonuclease Vsr
MDILTPERRSSNMRAIRSKDMQPELMVRRLVHKLGFRLHRKDLPGKPDLVFASRRKVIFVHGCFWLSHDCKAAHIPKSNVSAPRGLGHRWRRGHSRRWVKPKLICQVALALRSFRLRMSTTKPIVRCAGGTLDPKLSTENSETRVATVWGQIVPPDVRPFDTLPGSTTNQVNYDYDDRQD